MRVYKISSICLLTLVSLLFYNCSFENVMSDTAESWAITEFVKQDSINPILTPSSKQSFYCPVRDTIVNWEARNVLNPAAIVKDNQVYLFYRAQDQYMTSRIGIAVSEDGLHFEKMAEPMFFPDEDNMKTYEWPGGVEDPRIVEDQDGRYVLTYTSYDGEVARLFIASSEDLISWVKHGPVLQSEKYIDTWSKSGAIVSRLVGSRIVATKIHGKYWMYFGDTDLFMATSEDLVHWEVLEDTQLDRKISVLHPRPGFFDSRLVEPGPYALIRDEGILVIYNSMNAISNNDPNLPVGTYAAGQALFDKDEPYKLIDRLDHHFLHPDKDYEKVGEVNEVCFVEGMVFFKNKWFLYYGTADSRIAVAIRE